MEDLEEVARDGARMVEEAVEAGAKDVVRA
jgi:hypothetical protein